MAHTMDQKCDHVIFVPQPKFIQDLVVFFQQPDQFNQYILLTVPYIHFIVQLNCT